MTAKGSTGARAMAGAGLRARARPAARQHHQDARGRHARQSSAPRSRSHAAYSRPALAARAQPLKHRRQRKAGALEQNRCTNIIPTSTPAAIQASIAPAAARPRSVMAVKTTSAPTRMKAASRGDEKERRRAAERVPVFAAALFPDRAPVEQQRGGPQRHGEHSRPEFRRRHREHGNADHQQHRHRRVGRADDRAAEREHAPICRDRRKSATAHRRRTGRRRETQFPRASKRAADRNHRQAEIRGRWRARAPARQAARRRTTAAP